jgi:polysaccharide biosynthesis protein PslG
VTAPTAAATTAPTTTAPTTTAPTTTTPPTASAPLNGLRVGLSYGDTLPGLSLAALDSELNDAVQLGVGWIRLDLAWDDIQPTSQSNFNWSAFDRIVTEANARHLSLLPILDYTPGWARDPSCGSDKCAPANPAQFAAFAAAAASRYAPLGIHTWEIWNEPNITVFWQPAPNPSRYVSLLKATVAAIRAVDTGATLVSGGLSPAATGGGNISPVDFLTAFCQLGGQQVVDAIGFHPYSYPVTPGYQADWNAWQQIANTPANLTGVLAANGAAGKKIWLTEYGAPTNGPGAGATSSDLKLGQMPDHVDEALQAGMASQSVALASSSAVAGALFWYSYQDQGTDPANAENFYGLRRANGTPKPAYAALQQAIRTATS